jgi:hypothetical protein
MYFCCIARSGSFCYKISGSKITLGRKEMTTEESIYVDIIEDNVPPTSVLVTNAPVQANLKEYQEVGSLCPYQRDTLRFVSILDVRDRLDQARAWREANYTVQGLVPNLLEIARKYAKNV